MSIFDYSFLNHTTLQQANLIIQGRPSRMCVDVYSNPFLLRALETWCQPKFALLYRRYPKLQPRGCPGRSWLPAWETWEIGVMLYQRPSTLLSSVAPGWHFFHLKINPENFSLLRCFHSFASLVRRSSTFTHVNCTFSNICKIWCGRQRQQPAPSLPSW